MRRDRGRYESREISHKDSWDTTITCDCGCRFTAYMGMSVPTCPQCGKWFF